MTAATHAIPLRDVKSSQVKAVGYDSATKTLAVHYHGGGLYHYHDVSEDAYHALHKAQSVGKFLHASIKPKHRYTKMES